MSEDNRLNEVVIIKSSTETYHILAIRNAIRIAKLVRHSVKKVIFCRDNVEVEVSEMDSERSLYDKFIKAQKQRVCNLAINNNEF